VLILSFLMVSRVRFRSFKELRLTVKTVGVVMLIGGACATWLMAGFAKAFIFLFLVLAYIVLGLAEEVLFYRRRRAQERSAKLSPSPDVPQVPDEEVLRELGAFDDEPEDQNTNKDKPPASEANGTSGAPANPLVTPGR